ncbi:flagellar hook-associated protein FlgK [Pikeienuella piscinae]|uniref:Flagellar hook-associated protein 1 n=1 Tax=Pikeienuella piscinae TaxID=2748098 RepID=A0A7L5BTK4_9RHOB|nr:flagellar hook-associated protein FlgK [Pikeienuella piscinae]QIE55390.1 flagellar hook-associated protein FlgK [Pikeienuella piscinae]
MTLSLALSNAVTGLRATTAQTEVISNNVSNALSEDYARRDVAVSASAIGGVRVEGVTRAIAPAITDALRLAGAVAGDAGSRADALTRIAAAIGEPGAEGALATAADALDAAFAAAANTPESAQLISAAFVAADEYAGKINETAGETMALRTDADASIARQVAAINDAIRRIEALNQEIRSRVVAGGDISTLEDRRDGLVRTISDMVPLKVVQRDNGAIALFARNGAQLLDGKIFELSFQTTVLVTPDRTIANGGVSGLVVNGLPVRIGEGDGTGLMDGGTLSAAFELRDRIIPGIAAGLDDLAADLIQRTQGLAADPTLAPGDAGLFTDGGAAYDPADLIGVALRLDVNPAVDPDRGGELFRLRDGIGAATEGDVGASAVLRGLQDALVAQVAAPSGSGLSGSRSAAGFAAEISAQLLTRAASAESEAVYQRGRADEFSDAQLARTGVDTDQELARLLVVEQAFAANARVISVVDELLARLINL